MDTIILFTVGTAVFLAALLFLLFRSRSRGYHLPPSPVTPLPIIGHLHLLKEPLHQTLQHYAHACGPIFSLKLGFRRAVIISSPELVEECYTSHDIVLSNRPQVMSDKYTGYDHTTINGAPYGPRWRSLRRLFAQEVLSVSRINMYSKIRYEENIRKLRSMPVAAGTATAVEIRPMVYDLIFNVIMRMLTGKRYMGDYLPQYMETMSEFFENAQTSNPEDFLPFLQWIDYRGLKKMMIQLGAKLNNFYHGLLQETRQDDNRNCIIGHLLSLQQSDPEFYDDQLIKGFMTIMVSGSLDTTVVAAEWVMCQLLNHPDIFQAAREEIESQVGLDRLIEEKDIPNLPYLHAIIMETLRMFPPGPLLLPRESSADCVIGGYDVPKGTIVMINAYAIQRDPKYWEEPLSFKPERFVGKDMDMSKMLPFGMGRRSCPGSTLAQRTLGLILGSLIQCYDWKTENKKLIDLTEGVGLTLPKLKPLVAICKPRAEMLKILQELSNVD